MLVNTCFCVGLSLILYLKIAALDGDHVRTCSRRYARMVTNICASARRQETLEINKSGELINA